MWTEPWVPIKTDFMVRGVRNNEVKWVSALISGGSWILKRVEKFFKGDDSGIYLTCSGYRCARQMKRIGAMRGLVEGESSEESLSILAGTIYGE
ncbi:hypothetical protein LIER_42727 [Lithospermum erythrorhizon]|uniref:Uncharacterized protein n=1 Tax=Lithospermum erythrorhizon TaxID=34254 RepID=A0AAV3NUK9_LITER